MRYTGGMKERLFVPLYDSVSALLSDMASELLTATKGQRLSLKKLSEFIDGISARYTAHVIIRFNEMLVRERRAMQNSTYAQPEGAKKGKL